MLDFVVDVAVSAGRLLLERYRPLGRREIVNRKESQVRNLVTEADRASEDYILERLGREFPEHRLKAEESGDSGGSGEPLWYVDPLDGTVNFAHSHPFFAVSIGLVMDGKPVLGAVHAPVLNETFAGEVGRGATLNGQEMRVSDTTELMESLLATGFGYARNESPDHNVDNFERLVFKARGIRRAGAAALDLAYVAAGRLDGFWELHLSPWDVAAGAAILMAAGGQVTDFHGGSNYLTGKHIVATNGLVHEQLRTALHPLRGLS